MEPLTKEEQAELTERVKIFSCKYASAMQKLIKLTNNSETMGFLQQYDAIICQEAVVYLSTVTEDLARKKQYADMKVALRQSLTLQFILGISEELKDDPRHCAWLFFQRISQPDGKHRRTFNKALATLTKKVEELSETELKSKAAAEPLGSKTNELVKKETTPPDKPQVANIPIKHIASAFSKTKINIRPDEIVTEQKKSFEEKCGTGLKQFAKLDSLTDSMNFLTHYPEFVCAESVPFIRSIANKLAEENKMKEMRVVLRQCLTIKFILMLMKEESVQDPRPCVMMFYKRMIERGSEYYQNFVVTLGMLTQTTRENVAKKKAKGDAAKPNVEESNPEQTKTVVEAIQAAGDATEEATKIQEESKLEANEKEVNQTVEAKTEEFKQFLYKYKESKVENETKTNKSTTDEVEDFKTCLDMLKLVKTNVAKLEDSKKEAKKNVNKSDAIKPKDFEQDAAEAEEILILEDIETETKIKSTAAKPKYVELEEAEAKETIKVEDIMTETKINLTKSGATIVVEQDEAEAEETMTGMVKLKDMEKLILCTNEVKKDVSEIEGPSSMQK